MRAQLHRQDGTGASQLRAKYHRCSGNEIGRRVLVAVFADPSIEAVTIFFGGGTPSLLSAPELQRIIQSCRDSFTLAADSEITVEANPESATAETLDGFRAAGANRLSFGVQSFRDEELRRLGRLHSAQTARDAVRRARAAGFDNLSLDLMMWLPGQSTAEWLASVDALIEQ